MPVGKQTNQQVNAEAVADTTGAIGSLGMVGFLLIQ